jgi:hypothetical protein
MSEYFFQTRISLKSPSGALETCEVSGAHLGHTDVALRIDSPTLGSRTFVAPDLFLALLEFRRQIEPDGWRVLVNGARRDAWPSGMSAQMSGGTKLYLLPQGRKPAMRDVVETFDPAGSDDVVTVEEQSRFRDEYFNGPLLRP